MRACRAFENEFRGRNGLVKKNYLSVAVSIFFVFAARPCERLAADPLRKDIRALSRHFLDRNGKTAPWIFLPEENIASISTSEHAGVVTIWVKKAEASAMTRPTSSS